MARRQLCSITIIVDVPTSGLGHATLEELSLSLRDDFYDRLGRLLPDVSSSPQLVLDTHHGPDVSSSSQLVLETHQMPTKSLKIGCSLPAQLVPSMAVALMLSKALITALTVACHRLDCLQYGYTMLLNDHITLVKDISAAKVRLCTVEDCCLPSQGSGKSDAKVRCLEVRWLLQK